MTIVKDKAHARHFGTMPAAVGETRVNAHSKRVSAQYARMGSPEQRLKATVTALVEEAEQDVYGQAGQVAVEQQAQALHEEHPVTLELSLGALNNPWKEMIAESKRAKIARLNKNNGPTDESRRLTRMLVNARTQNEVRNVLSAAYKNMVSWQMASSQGDNDATAVVRRLNRLIARANRKVRDLNREDDMQRRRERAEKAEREQLARQLREELNRVRIRRRQREQSYLRDMDPKKSKSSNVRDEFLATLETKIMALTQALVQLSTISAGVGSVAVCGGSGGAAGSGSAAGEAATAGEEAVLSD